MVDWRNPGPSRLSARRPTCPLSPGGRPGHGPGLAWRRASSSAAELMTDAVGSSSTIPKLAGITRVRGRAHPRLSHAEPHGPAPFDATHRSIIDQLRTRSSNFSQAVRSFLPVSTNMRTPWLRNAIALSVFLAMPLSRVNTIRSWPPAPIIGSQSGSNVPLGTSGKSGCPGCTTSSRNAASA